MANYDTLTTVPAHQQFFRRMWRRRDPIPAAAQNPRVSGHYRRLVQAEADFAYYGPRDWWKDPDKQRLLTYPAVYFLNEEFNDKGLMFIRHGVPDERIATVSENVVSNESWRYYGVAGSGEMIIHFASTAGANWRLVPYLLGAEVMADRTDWGNPYIHGYRVYRQEDQQRELDIPMLAEEIREATQLSVDVGLSTDRHAWSEDVRPLDMPVRVATFRGEGNAAQAYVLYAFPTQDIARAVAPGVDRVNLEIGVTVLDPSWATAFEQREVKALPLSDRAGDGVIDGVRFTLAPDTFRVALYVQPEGTNVLGAYQFDHLVPDYSASELMVSDILMAWDVQPAEAPGRFVWNDLQVVPQPTHRYRVEQPVFVYFEVYNLTFGATDETDYTLGYTLKPLRERRRLFGRRNRPALTLETRHQGRTAHPYEYGEIDVSRVEPGDYLLTVTITDEHTGASTTREAQITLLK